MPKNNLLERKERLKKILSFLKKEYPDAKCHLDYNNPVELLVGSILSAQCTDLRVNEVTKDLFRKYTNAYEFSLADIDELKEDIRSTGFFNNKAKSILECTKALVRDHDGVVPETMEELTKLRGVGRKTANVILGNYYGKPGIIVDTHIGRLSRRLGLTENEDPVKVEFDLRDIVPENDCTFFSNSLGDHGRTICKSRKPLCDNCKISDICPSSGLFN
ncbi:MAG: endonuclease III [Thermodesulfobacteriota bacterium]